MLVTLVRLFFFLLNFYYSFFKFYCLSITKSSLMLLYCHKPSCQLVRLFFLLPVHFFFWPSDHISQSSLLALVLRNCLHISRHPGGRGGTRAWDSAYGTSSYSFLGILAKGRCSHLKGSLAPQGARLPEGHTPPHPEKL